MTPNINGTLSVRLSGKMIKLVTSLVLLLGAISLPAKANASPPVVRQVECERVNSTSLIPRAEESFRRVYRDRFASGEIDPNQKLDFAHGEFSFNQGAWLLPFIVATKRGPETYFALVNCLSGVEFSRGDILGVE